MEKLYELLEEMRPDVDFRNEKALVDDGILDSFDVVNIASEFLDRFNVEITAEHIKPENLNSAEAMWALIQSLKTGKG